MSQRPLETADERLGGNVRALRTRRGLSQADLAAAMTERGHSWHQQTVGRVENGRQPVRFAEAVDLAAILGTTLDRLTWSSAESQIVEYLNAGGLAVVDAHEAVADSVRRLLAAVAAVQADTAKHKTHESELVQEARRDALGRVADYGDVDDAVAEGARRYEERQGQ